MGGGKRDADAAGLENHDPPDTAALIDIALMVPLAFPDFDSFTFADLLSLKQTPVINLVDTHFFNVCITLRFMYAATLNGADLFHHEA